MKAYLFSQPAVHIWSWLFSANSRFTPNAAQSAQWNRGAYLAEALAHCGECHTPRNLAFALDNRKKFTGAVTAGWRAFNITSDKASGIGSWSDDEVSAYLATGHALNHGTAAGPMGEAVDQSFSRMSESDIRALVVYLRSVPAIASPDLPAAIAAPAPASPKEGKASSDALGKKVFQEACVSCHDWTGVSAISSYATLAGARAVNDPAATNVAQT
jgi:mono/diheme cytochrome c family protein